MVIAILSGLLVLVVVSVLIFFEPLAKSKGMRRHYKDETMGDEQQYFDESMGASVIGVTVAIIIPFLVIALLFVTDR